MCFICDEYLPELQESHAGFEALIGSGCAGAKRLSLMDQEKASGFFQRNLAAAKVLAPHYVRCVNVGNRPVCLRCHRLGNTFLTHAGIHQGTILVRCLNPVCHWGPYDHESFGPSLYKFVAGEYRKGGQTMEEMKRRMGRALSNFWEVSQTATGFDPTATPILTTDRWSEELFESVGLAVICTGK